MTSPGPRTTPPTPALEVFTPGARPRALTSFIPVPACCTEPRLGKTSVPLFLHHLLHHSRSRFGFSLVHETPSRAELHSARPTITVPWPTHVSFEAGALEGTLQWPVPRILYPFSLLFWESRLGNKLIRGASLHASLLSPLARYNLLLVCLESWRLRLGPSFTWHSLPSAPWPTHSSSDAGPGSVSAVILRNPA